MNTSYSVFRIRRCGTIFSSVDSLTCRLSVSKVKLPQMQETRNMKIPKTEFIS